MVDSSIGSADPAEERASPVESAKPVRRGSIRVSAPPTAPEAAGNSSVLEGTPMQQQGEAPQQSSSSSRPSVYRQSSAHRLFRAAPPEPAKQQWNTLHVNTSDEAAAGAGGVAPMDGGDSSRLRASSWHASDHARLVDDGNAHNSDRFFPKRRGRDDREVCMRVCLCVFGISWCGVVRLSYHITIRPHLIFCVGCLQLGTLFASFRSTIFMSVAQTASHQHSALLLVSPAC